MKWNIETEEEKNRKLSNWHTWFAWYPITITESFPKRSQKVWLETVFRRGRLYRDMQGDNQWRWEYR